MQDVRADRTRRAVVIALFGTLVMAAIGLAIARDLADSWTIAGAMLGIAVLVAAVSPAAGISAVLLALPSIHHLHPMPRGEFTLLELAILVAVVGTGFNVVIRLFRGGADDLLSLAVPAQIVVPVLVLIVATGVSLLTLADPAYKAESLREVRTVIVEPLLFLGAARIVLRDHIARWWTAGVFLVAGVAMSIYAIAQVTMGWGGVEAGSVLRATGTYTHPNNLAFFLERTLLFTIAALVVRPRWWPVWVLALVQLAGVFITYSRGAFAAVAIGVAVILLLRGMYKALLGLMAAGVVAGGAAFAIAPDRIIDAGGSGSEPTRFAIWRSSLRMAIDHPIFGVGPDQFLYQYWRRYVEPMGWPERYTSHPHNLILDFWLRLGVPGLAFAGTLVVGVVWLVQRSLASLRMDIVGMGAVAALAGGIAHGMFDNGFFLPDLATMTWFFIACLVTVPARVEPTVLRNSSDGA